MKEKKKCDVLKQEQEERERLAKEQREREERERLAKEKREQEEREQPPPPKQQGTVNPANSHSYQRLDNSLNWNVAKTVCSNMGAHLATITSQEENDWIYRNIANGNRVWIGGTDEGHESFWNWITNETWNYTNWIAGEPNNAPNGSGDSGENSLIMEANGQWNDGHASDNFSYICEWEPEP